MALTHAQLCRQRVLRPNDLNSPIKGFNIAHGSRIKHCSVAIVNTAVFAPSDAITIVLNTFQSRLKEAREKKGWSQAKLAEAVGLTQSAIGNLEARAGAQTTKAVEIALALDVHPLWLQTGKPPREVPSGAFELSDQERDLVLAFRYLAEDERKELVNDVLKLAAQAPQLQDVLRKEIGMAEHADPGRVDERLAPAPTGPIPQPRAAAHNKRHTHRKVRKKVG